VRFSGRVHDEIREKPVGRTRVNFCRRCFASTFFGLFRCSRRRLQNEQWCSNDTVVEFLSTNHDDIITSSLKQKGTLSNRPDNFVVFRRRHPLPEN